MILSVHATFGAAVASLVPTHPVMAFSLGFVSHLVLDAIPHKDYDLISVETEPGRRPQLIDTIYKKFRLIRDMMLVSFDALVGICLAFIFFFDPAYPWIFFLGVAGAFLPDFLTFLYLFIEHKPLGLFLGFHVDIIHSKMILNLNQVVGVCLQFCTLAVLIALLFGIKSLL